jgi:hypothetical protein
MSKQGIESEGMRKNIIKSLIQLKHQSQNLTNKKLSFPLPAADILLLTPIDLREFKINYQNILDCLKQLESENKNLKQVLSKFPEIKTERYKSSIIKRSILVVAAILLFFPLGVLIYYIVLSRRGELKSKLTEIINATHKIVHLIQSSEQK